MCHISARSVTGVQRLEILFQAQKSIGITKRKANSFPDELNASCWGKFTDDPRPKVILLSNLRLQFVMIVITTEAEILSFVQQVWGHVDARVITTHMLAVMGMVGS